MSAESLVLIKEKTDILVEQTKTNPQKTLKVENDTSNRQFRFKLHWI